ncbi:adaptin ear-binding coat-associated protein 1 NECAP-1 [Dipodascopsis uninucleata]
MNMDYVESVTYIAREVLVYQIPPLRSSKGYRAAEWSVDNPLWRGRMRILEISPTTSSRSGSYLKCEIRLEDVDTGELFACAPYFENGKGVEQVLDSTRFFVIRVVDGNRHAYLGMGFQERSDAFDFNIALQDFKRHAAPLDTTASFGNSKPADKKEPELKDYSLEDGKTITISLKVD